MKVSADFSALRERSWKQYAVRFVVGGLVTVITGLIAKKFGPGWGGLFLAFPAIFPATATLLARHEREKKARAGINGRRRGSRVAALDAAGAVLGAVSLPLFAVCVWLGLTRYAVPPVLALATIVWLAVALALWWLRKSQGWRLPGSAIGARRSFSAIDR